MENGMRCEMVLSNIEHVRETSTFFDKEFILKDNAVDLIHLDLNKTFETAIQRTGIGIKNCVKTLVGHFERGCNILGLFKSYF